MSKRIVAYVDCIECGRTISKTNIGKHTAVCNGPSSRLTNVIQNHPTGFQCTRCKTIFNKASGLGKHNPKCTGNIPSRQLDRFVWGEFTYVTKKTCRKTGKEFWTSNGSATIHPAEKPALRTYRARASFKFKVYDFPDRFDLNLVEQYGWYSPGGRNSKNKDINMTRVSRDHLYSIYDGWIGDVDPLILAHPANCKLLLQSENVRKRNKSTITLDDLLFRIETW